MSKEKDQRKNLEDYKKKMKEFYSENLEFLKLEHEYYKLQADIEIAKLTILKASTEYLALKQNFEKGENKNDSK